MAEFIFDLQRFDDGDGGDTGSDTSTTGDTDTGSDTSNMSATAGTSGSNGSSSGSSSSSSSGSGGTGGTSGSSGGGGPATSGGRDSSGGYTYSQWNAVYDNAVDNHDTAVELGTYNYYVGTYGVADNFQVSRYAINIIENVDQFDTITFTDANSWDFVAYNQSTHYVNDNVIGSDLAIALNLTSDVDSGAGSLTRIFYSDAYATGLDYFSPTIAFANENLIYSNTTGWTTPENVAFSEYFWSTCITQSGNAYLPEVFTVSRGFNNYITNVDAYDTILFSDASLFKDLISANRVNGGVALNFLDGTSTIIEYSGTFSPTIQLASGETFVYNSRMDAWRTPEEAATDAATYAAEALNDIYLSGTDAADTFLVNRSDDTFIYDTYDTDRIIFADDTTWSNITSWSAAGYDITLNFDTGSTMTVEYLDNLSPTFEFADGQTYVYSWLSSGWEPVTNLGNNLIDFVDLSSGTDNSIYNAEFLDHIHFTDTDESHITDINITDRNLTFTFDNGTTTDIRYIPDSFGYGWTPHVYFGNNGGYFYSGSLNRWLDAGMNYDTAKALYGSGSSGSSGSSADLWGDTFTGTAEADNLFVGTHANSIVDNVDSQDSVTFDASLSDIVATSVEGNTIAVAFTSGTTAVIQTAGDSPTFNLASGESYIYDRQAASWKTA